MNGPGSDEMADDGVRNDGADANEADARGDGPVGDMDNGDERPTDMGDLFDELTELEETVDSPEERERVRDAIRTALDVEHRAVFGRVVRGFDRGDLTEALIGSLVFGIPMAVEGGTNEVGAFVATHPIYLLSTLAFAIAMVVGILYVADIQDVRIHEPFFGVLPRRLVGVIGVSYLTSLTLLTVWGRVDWASPWVAVCTVSVAFVPMAIGAALGDILPGS